jgi:putative transposase
VTERNGHRPRVVTTKADDVERLFLEVRTGSCFPVLLEPRLRTINCEAVLIEAYVHSAFTRSLDNLAEAMAANTGISEFEVFRICAGLVETVGVFHTRSLEAHRVHLRRFRLLAGGSR